VRRSVPITVIIAGSLLALVAMAPGLDYFADSGSIDALARGDWHSFFAEQPLMGSLTLFLRAPFVRLVFHSNLTVVYFAGALPCALALVWLAAHLWRRMARDGRSRDERLLVALLCVGSITLIRAIHWGHPEDIVATALVVGAVFAAAAGRPLASGAMVGAAVASKQWAVLAALPALLVLPDGRRVFLGASATVVALLTVPMYLGDPDRFMRVVEAAGSVGPMQVLEHKAVAPGAHVNPFDVWFPFATKREYLGQELFFADAGLISLAHPLILVAGAALPLLAWWRARRLDLLRGLQLLALILLLRCALDPMSLEYYHLPAVVALAGAAAAGGRRELDFALRVCAGLSVAFVQPALDVAHLEDAATLKFAAYMGVVVPSVWWLARELATALRPARALSRLATAT
jgi:hypothetical protein